MTVVLRAPSGKRHELPKNVVLELFDSNQNLIGLVMGENQTVRVLSVEDEEFHNYVRISGLNAGKVLVHRGGH